MRVSHDEFSLIERYFTRPWRHRHVRLGIGDDAALIRVSSCTRVLSACHHHALTATGMQDHDPAETASSLVQGCLDRLPATGVRSRWCTLSLSLPAIDEAWLSAFSEALLQLCERHDMPLVGGDTTRGTGMLVLHASACMDA